MDVWTRPLRRALGALRGAGRRTGDVLGDALLSALVGRPPPGPVGTPRSIFVLRNNDLGDLLVATPLFDALRRRFPDAEIVAGVGRWATGILAHNPHLTGHLQIDAPWHNKFVHPANAWSRLRYLARSPVVRQLRRRRFEVGIDVVGSRWGSLLFWRAAIPFRLGVRGYAGGHTAAQAWVQFDPGEHVSRAALRFAELLGATDLPPCRPQLFLSPGERAVGDQAWRSVEGGRDSGATRVVVAPGAGLARKAWPLPCFQELAARLSRLPGLAVAAAGGPGDRPAGERLAASSAIVNLAGLLSLRETFALIAGADLVVCNSSVWLHAAAAFRRPTVVLLGEAFASARQHDAQWGYPGACWSLGREPEERRGLASPDEAAAKIEQALAELVPGRVEAP